MHLFSYHISSKNKTKLLKLQKTCNFPANKKINKISSHGYMALKMGEGQSSLQNIINTWKLQF